MRTVFDKAREDAAAYAADFIGNDVFKDASTKTAQNCLSMVKWLSNLMVAIVSDYGAKSIKVAISPVDFERCQFHFILDPKTTDAEYVSVMRLWNDMNRFRKNGDDGILVMAGENNLPILSCQCDCLRDVLWGVCEAHGLTKYYKLHFDAIDALRQRVAMGEAPKMN